MSELSVKIAETIDDLNEVYRLTYQSYLSENYCSIDPAEILIHYAKLDTVPSTRILMLYDGDEFVASNSIKIDCLAGFHCDEDFPDEVNVLRTECYDNDRILGASWRIVTTEKARTTRKIVFELIRKTINVGMMLGIDICLFTFNPKHEQFYQRFLNLETIAMGVCRAANNAPAILMVGVRDRIISSRIMN